MADLVGVAVFAVALATFWLHPQVNRLRRRWSAPTAASGGGFRRTRPASR